MSLIPIKLFPDFDIFGNADELSKGLRNDSKSTESFRKAIGKFLKEFNNKYQTQVEFTQVLDIYDGKSDLDLEQNIILCKALLDFIQNNGMEISFENKSCMLKYSTISIINSTLINNEISEGEKIIFDELTLTILSFIQEIRKKFSMIIADSIPLYEANIDNYFTKIYGISTQKDILNSNDSQDKIVKIEEGFYIKSTITDFELIDLISNLNNPLLKSFFNYIYSKMDDVDKTTKMHIDVANYIFDNCTPNGKQRIRKVIYDEQTLRIETVSKFNFRKLKRLLFGNSIKLKEDDTKKEIYLEGEVLYLGEGVELNLKDDESFENSLISLSADNVRKLFGFIENIVISQNASGNTTSILVGILQKSEKSESSIRQKILNLRKKGSKILKKFIDNNVNVTAFRKFLFENAGIDLTLNKNNGVEDSFLLNNNSREKKQNKTFYFIFASEKEYGKKECIKIELDGRKSMKSFIFSLNSFITQYCKNFDLECLIDEFRLEDFEDIKLDSEFFNNIILKKNQLKFDDLFDLIDREILEKFLNDWHSKVYKDVKQAPKLYIKPGSREELWNFVFNVLEPVLNEKADNQEGKGANNNEIKRIKLKKAMFKGVDKLTFELFDNIENLTQFTEIFSYTNISKEEIVEMIKDYKREILIENMF